MSKWKVTLPRDVPKDGRVAFALGIKNSRGRYEIANKDAPELVATAAFLLLRSADEEKARQVLTNLFPKAEPKSEGGEA